MKWVPLSGDGIRQVTAVAEGRMSARQQCLWNAIRIDPEKWSKSPYGDDGGGFWAVGLIGRIVVWYNDIEGGFERSRYRTHGSITEYTCGQFELEHVMEQLLSLIETGQITGQVRGSPQPVNLPPC